MIIKIIVWQKKCNKMAYGNKVLKLNLFRVFKIRISRIIVSSFPLNSIRVWALRRCGFKVGKNVYIGIGLILTMLNEKSGCELFIGDRVAVAPRVTLVLGSDANWSRLTNIIPPVEGKITLEDDCWIGTGVVVLPNIKIGEMSVVGAGSVVNKDVPPFTIVAGNPAKHIKSLPNKEEI